MSSSGQVSIEYLILIGVVMILVVVPASLFLTSISRSTVQETLGTEKVSELGDGLTLAAKQLYYLGLYAKRKVVLPVPENVERFYLLKINDGTKDYHYIVIRVNDGSKAQQFFFESVAPLTSDTSAPNVKVDDFSADIPECSSASCSFISFTGNALRTGKKQFRLETVQQAGEVMVEIVPMVGP
jgi:hypothetical protein